MRITESKPEKANVYIIKVINGFETLVVNTVE